MKLAKPFFSAKEPKFGPSPTELAYKGKAPGFIRPLTICRVAEGGRATFSCLPYGEPFPTVKWLKDGLEVTPSDRFKISALPDGTQQLVIEDVDLADAACYRCVLTNEHGTSSSKADLVVERECS